MLPDIQPDILLIVTDQERSWGWLPETDLFWRQYLPNRHRLRQQGLTFRNFHVHSAPCSPNRSVLYTGRHVDETGIHANVTLPAQRSLDPDMLTVGDMLQAAGYKVGYKGKFHLVRNLYALPWEHGQPSLREYGFDDWDGEDHTSAGTTHGRDDVRIADHAIDWIAYHGRRSQPWFLAVNFVNPHDINDYPSADPPERDHAMPLPANVIDDLDTKPSIQGWWQKGLFDLENRVHPGDRATWEGLLDAYLFHMKRVDQQLGRVLDALEQHGRPAETVIVFTSDHGELGGAHTLRTKGPEVYRESMEVPLVISHPRYARHWDRETVCLGAAIDLVPTLLSFAGRSGADYGLRGRDLTPVLADPGEPTTRVRDSVLYTYRGLEATLCPVPNRNLRGIYTLGPEGEYKFARYYPPGKAEGELCEMELELYDYADYRGAVRPLETLNRAYQSGYEETVYRLNERLEALYDEEVGESRTSPPGPASD